MYDRIIVPLDGSPFAEQVLSLAAAIARRTGMALELVKVHHARPVGYAQDTMLAALDLDARDLELSAGYLARIARELGEGTGLAVRTSVLEDASPPVAICNEAERVGATLIAMATHGRTGLLRTVRGSVADGVLRHTTAPVLLWRVSEPPQPVPAAPAHVLVALDGSTWAEMVVPTAAVLARVLGARLSLVRVVAHVAAVLPAPVATIGDVPFAGPGWLPPEIDRAATQRAVERARGYLHHVVDRIHAEHPGLVVGVHAVADDDAAATILRLTSEVHADVVAMTTHARGASRFIVGSTVDKVLRGRAGVTLLVRPTAPTPRG